MLWIPTFLWSQRPGEREVLVHVHVHNRYSLFEYSDINVTKYVEILRLYATYLEFCVCMYTVSAQIKGHSWLERHASTLFSKICQFLRFYLVKFSKKSVKNL